MVSIRDVHIEITAEIANAEKEIERGIMEILDRYDTCNIKLYAEQTISKQETKGEQ